LLSNPQRIRLVIVVIALCLILAALFVPTVVTFAGNMGGGGS
jgi:hypothetical protein